MRFTRTAQAVPFLRDRPQLPAAALFLECSRVRQVQVVPSEPEGWLGLLVVTPGASLRGSSRNGWDAQARDEVVANPKRCGQSREEATKTLEAGDMLGDPMCPSRLARLPALTHLRNVSAPVNMAPHISSASFESITLRARSHVVRILSAPPSTVCCPAQLVREP